MTPMNTIGKKIEPEDVSGQSAQPAPAASEDVHDAVLGSLSNEAKPEEGGISTGSTGAKDISSVQKKADASASPADTEPLTLPRGALVTLRRSGGLRFTSRTITVHRDGQISHSLTGTGTRGLRDKVKSAPSHVSNEQLSDLKIAVSQAGLDATATRKIGASKQSPDSYAYEIIARLGNKQTAIEVVDGSIPQTLKPLIRKLSALMVK